MGEAVVEQQQTYCGPGADGGQWYRPESVWAPDSDDVFGGHVVKAPTAGWPGRGTTACGADPSLARLAEKIARLQSDWWGDAATQQTTHQLQAALEQISALSARLAEVEAQLAELRGADASILARRQREHEEAILAHMREKGHDGGPRSRDLPPLPEPVVKAILAEV